MDEKTRISVDIYGMTYRLMGNSSTGYMKKVAEYVDDQMRSIAKGHPRLDLPRIAVLAAVNIADELVKAMQVLEEEKNNPQLQELQQAVRQLQQERDRLEQQNNSVRQQLEAGKQKQQELTHEVQKWKSEYEESVRKHEEASRQEKSEDQASDNIRADYEKLKEEYAKLQSEYNEWIQLLEQDSLGERKS